MNLSLRARHFLQKPWQTKITSAEYRFRSLWFRLLPSIPLPIPLPYGGWWLASDDGLSNSILIDNFEKSEWRFVNRLLKKGMTVIDVGAHRGFYTILSSKKVGPSGRVIAFEPSPREEQRLALHLRINRCKNVKVERFALAGQNGEAEFFVVEGRGTVFNSLRHPAVSSLTKKIIVKTLTLDNYLKVKNIPCIDFMKIDAEGAELEIIKGANGLLNLNSSPIIMAEVSDMRTEQWGYQSSKILDHISEQGYRWFLVNSEGKLEPFREKGLFHNFVAVPEGKLTKMKDFIRV